MKKIGFTGTRKGMTTPQRNTLRYMLTIYTGSEFHHGDCIGADNQAHGDAIQCGMRVVVHPPILDRLRAFCKGHETRDPKPYLVRNREIVGETDLLIACPDVANEIERSGTWATVRFARSIKRPIWIILPDGYEVPIFAKEYPQ
jgi:hypothetical protein